MITSINFSLFTGHADLTGAELEALTKILTKCFGTDQQYVNSRYVAIRNDRKLVAKFEVDTDTEFMTRAAYEIERDDQDAREAKLAAEQLADRIAALDQLIGENTEENRTALLKVLEDQSLLYYNEKPANNPVNGWVIDDEGTTFYAGKLGSIKRLNLDRAGKFTRTEAGF